MSKTIPTSRKIAAGLVVPTIAALGLGFASLSTAEALSPSATTMCSNVGAMGCSVSYQLGTMSNGVPEGTTVKAMLQGQKGQTINFSLFKIGGTSDAPTLTKIGGDVPATFDSSGYASVDIPLPTFTYPDETVSEGFLVQPSDTSDPNSLVPNSSGKVETFTINSARAQVVGEKSKPANGSYYVPGDLITYSLDGGIEGDQYVVQMKQTDGTWKTISDTAFGFINSYGSGAVSWVMPDLATGEYPIRISNVDALDKPVYEYNFVVTDGTTPTPTPTVDPTSTPTVDPTPSGTPTPSTSATPTVDPTPSSTPSVSLIATDLIGADGTGAAEYTINGDILTSEGILMGADGKPVANATITLYDYTNGVRGAVLGTGTTDANGAFKFDSTLPAGWDTNATFNAELAYAGDETHEPISLFMEVAGSTPSTTPSTSTTPSETPSTTPSVSVTPSVDPTPEPKPYKKPDIVTGGDPSQGAPLGLFLLSGGAAAAAAGSLALRRRFKKAE